MEIVLRHSTGAATACGFFFFDSYVVLFGLMQARAVVRCGHNRTQHYRLGLVHAGEQQQRVAPADGDETTAVQAAVTGNSNSSLVMAVAAGSQVASLGNYPIPYLENLRL